MRSTSRKKNNHEEPHGQERWLVSYADFITLLFAFFVVLYATSNQNQEKEKQFEKSIREQLKLVGMMGLGKNSPNGGEGPGANGGLYGAIIDPVDSFQKSWLTNEELEDYVDKTLDEKLDEKDRKNSIPELRQDPRGVRMVLAASTFFPSGSAKLRLPATKILDKIAEILKKSKNNIEIEGHTDNQALPGGGQYDSNWELASLRAISVLRYFEQFQKIDPKRLSAVSYADKKPLAPNDNEPNRARNRRIEILILNPDAK